MKGTLVNSGGIIVGSLIGLSVGNRLPERFKKTVMQTLGLSVVVIGLQMALSVREVIPVVGCLLLGALTGELLEVEDWVERLGEWLKERFHSGSATFVEGFVSASVLYISGAMVIVGAIQDGAVGDASTLYLKAMLDGVASVAFASTLGLGVAFSAVPVLVVQGTITLLASQLLFLQDPRVLSAVTATGGVLILAIGINILELKKIPVGNLLPSLVYAVLWALV
ncbi:MAG: DUF554 domain-containing protein [Syntrophobacterales bacterium]|nr:DUF554 domain-containing protein [Syntrophobacterales bacterium]